MNMHIYGYDAGSVFYCFGRMSDKQDAYLVAKGFSERNKSQIYFVATVSEFSFSVLIAFKDGKAIEFELMKPKE